MDDDIGHELGFGLSSLGSTRGSRRHWGVTVNLDCTAPRFPKLLLPKTQKRPEKLILFCLFEVHRCKLLTPPDVPGPGGMYLHFCRRDSQIVSLRQAGLRSEAGEGEDHPHTAFAGAARAGGRCYCSRLPARPVRRSAVEVRSSCAPVSRPHGPQTARERTARGGRGAAHSDPLTRRSSARDLMTMVLDVQTGTNCATFRTIGDRDTAPCGAQGRSQNDRGKHFRCRPKSPTVRVFGCRLLDQLHHDESYPCV